MRLSDRSLMLRLGVLMALIVLLALGAMISSVIIAETTQGVATAVNQSGSLRMQSFRIATGLASLELPPGEGYPHDPGDLISEFEQRFASPRLTDAIPTERDHLINQAYRVVADDWKETIRPLVRIQSEAPGLAKSDAGGYLKQVDDFVAHIDDLVRKLEEFAESKIEKLRIIQAVCLSLIGIAVMISMITVHKRLLAPLRELLVCAERARGGDFSKRTPYVSNDELGRLGHAFNLMGEDLSKIYADLERRVHDKTVDLELKNRSLELLYTTSRQVNQVLVTEDSLKQVIADIEEKLALGSGTICLNLSDQDEPGRQFASTRGRDEPNAAYCWEQGCRACRSDSSELIAVPGAHGKLCRMMCFPIREQKRRFGVLMIDLREGEALEPWQQRVLETVAGHIGTAVNNHFRTQEIRRLALHEERGVIARELHDSLAQSLSYLKIQITRLDASLTGRVDVDSARVVVSELREGVTSAYRQLRELLTTFRLKMDGRGLNKALRETVQEFRNRSTVNIQLTNSLTPGLLSPNEEIHVLQIVREALSNVIRHAQARNAEVVLSARGSEVQVQVLDDGRGIATKAKHAPQHYGTTIMNERTQSLHGEIRIEPRAQGGTLVQVNFRKTTPQPNLELLNVG